MQSSFDTKTREKARLLQQAGQVSTSGCLPQGDRVPLREKSVPYPALPDETESWAQRLDEEKHSLVAMVASTESEFLATGEGLKLLAQQLGEIQGACKGLTDLTLGQTPDSAVQFAFQLLKKAEDLVLASDEQYDYVFAAFGELQRRLAQLAKQHTELIQVLEPLNVITISFRIEASRHSVEVQQAFFTLGDEVNRSVREVRATMEIQFHQLATSERIARGLMEQVAASIQLHRGEVSATLRTNRDQLRALGEALNGSWATAANLSRQNGAVTRHIGAIVMAQQCQDITRQRIDHVGEAMEEMGINLRRPHAMSPTANLDPRTFVFRAAQIQLYQVQSVFDDLLRAACNLKSGMQALRAEAVGAADAAVTMGRSALDAEIANECQAGIGQILAIVKQAVDRTGEVMGAFAPLQARSRECMSKATALAGEVRLAGINARIFAIQAPAGATLEVLADNVRAISEEVIEKVGRMGRALNHTTEIVSSLRGRLEDFQSIGETEHEVLANEAAISRLKLSELESEIPLLVGRVTAQQGAFAARVEAVLSQVRFPLTVAAASSRSIGFFKELVTWSGAAAQESEGETVDTKKIDLLKASYTMDSERRAHVAALQPVGPSIAEAAFSPAVAMFEEWAKRFPAPSGSDNEPASAPIAVVPVLEPIAASTELGDNVELF